MNSMGSMSDTARIVFVQTSDFRAAYERMSAGMGETYDAQTYSMEVVERLVPQAAVVAVICTCAEIPHDKTLPSGVRSIGLDDIWKQKRPFASVIAQLDALEPTHLILRSPSRPLLTWARQHGVRVLPSFADSFMLRRGLRGWIDRWRLRQLASELNRPEVGRVGNHNIAAAEGLATLGVAAEKIIPWDWPRSPTPADFSPKTAPAAGPKRLIFVGAVSEAKGVGDIIRALAADPRMGDGATLKVVGGGDIEGFQALARSLGVAKRVTFTGRLPHAEIAPAMHAADAVLVYSRHQYGEGLPGTIYLGFASRTPIVISDHPMFVAYFRDREDVLFAPEHAPDQLAARLRVLFDDPALYERLSRNGDSAFVRIAHPVLWGDFVECWLRNGPEECAWLDAQTLPKWRAMQLKMTDAMGTPETQS